MYIEGDVPLVTGNNGNNNNGFDYSGILGLIVVAGLFGNGGFGFGGGNRGNCATVADLAAGFNNSSVLAGLNEIKLGQQQAINYNNQGFAGLNTAITSGFYGVSHQISDCCYQTQRAIDGLRNDYARGVCDIIRSGQENTRSILDYLTGEKIASLQAENSGLKAQISNDRQSAYLLNELKPCPIPAYLTCNPNAPYGLGYGVGFGVNTHGCCGASVQ